jgi:hypothetical protein
MSVITKSLEKIVNWLQVNYPESVYGLPPGLSDSEIEKLTQPLSFNIPWEVREIYHFCNGSFTLAPSLILEPLNVAIENTRYADWMRGNEIPSSTKILPLFHGDGKDFYYVICDEQENDSPVWCVLVGLEPLEYAASLTSLILTAWECYETGAYYMKIYEDGYSYVEEDFKTFKKIFQKYNPEQMDTFRCVWGD